MNRGRQLLHKHITGGLTNEERFELEKIALDDDFVADAWEGLVVADPSKVQAALSRLEGRINEREGAKIIPLTKRLWPYAAAASVVLLSVFFFLLRPASTEELSTPASALVLDEMAVSTPESIPLSADAATDMTSADNEEVSREEAPTTREPLEVISPANPVIEDRTTSIVAATDNITTETPEIAETSFSNVVEADAESSNLQERHHPVSTLGERPKPEPASVLTEETIVIDNNAAIAKADAQAEDGHTDQLEEVTKENSAPTGGLSLKTKTKKDAPVLSQALSRKVNEQADYPQPKVGFNDYQAELIKKTTITNEDLFMIGLKPDFKVRSRFKVNNVGNPIEIEILNVPDGTTVKEKLVALLTVAGTWVNVGKEWTFYDFEMPVAE